MDYTAIVTGVVSGVITLIVCLINNHYQHEESEKKHEDNIVLISYRLECLEKEVSKHNNIVERVYELEKRQGMMDEQIKSITRD